MQTWRAQTNGMLVIVPKVHTKNNAQYDLLVLPATANPIEQNRHGDVPFKLRFCNYLHHHRFLKHRCLGRVFG